MRTCSIYIWHVLVGDLCLQVGQYCVADVLHLDCSRSTEF